ncbi:hypothetical protein F6V30_07900 [Oryzomonas sagensis]|uniref:Uncharacterized protein n=1 Tax=Oryzomonas sagensis TaxID=2603857 RepID=A0ABQ6TN68_9BACT|nr:hypothetical protein [Oryzomonas sagensis]KAB0670079.1 hypothetical protein F6V30_07900 [Oryzomonas sagensis]
MKPWNFFDRLMERSTCFKGGNSQQRIITADQVAAAQIAAKQWDDYQARVAPSENQFIKDVSQSPANLTNRLQGQTNANVMQAEASRQNPTPGVDPGRANNTNVTPALSGGLSAGYTAASNTAQDQSAKGLSAAVSMGRGQSAAALDSQMSLAEGSTQAALTRQAANAEASMADRGATFGMIGKGLGAAGAVGTYYMNQPALSNTDIMSGASSGPNGYSVSPSGAIAWNSSPNQTAGWLSP